MEFRWMKTYWTWIKYNWWAEYKNLWSDLWDSYFKFFYTIVVIILKMIEFIIEMFIRPIADIFKLGHYYNEK